MFLGNLNQIPFLSHCIEKKKEQTVDMKKLQFIASLQLVESALQVCPENVPEKIEKQFKIETERLKKLQGLGGK